MIIKTADFSTCRTWRYSLYRIWTLKKPHILFVCLNPSTADENINDPTVRRCIGFAESWGYGGMIMANMFAYRATDPKDMKSATDPIGPENDLYLSHLSKHSEITIMAWGNDGKYLNRDKEVVGLLKNKHYFKLTNIGQPCHPLYLKASLAPIKFKQDKYV